MIEQDPNGLKANEPGAKLDQGKPRIGLMTESFPLALTAVSAISTYGAVKYSRGGWAHVPNGIDRYTDAMLRHLLDPRFDDPESGLPHAAHAAWNALARLELMLRDRVRAFGPLPGYSPCVLQDYKVCDTCGDCK